MSCLVQEPPAPCTSQEGPCILIVDDSAVDRRVAGGIVAKVPGVRVVYASDGREALGAIDRERPSAVLTDLQMPGMDGLALVKEVRRVSPRTPVILMTYYGSEEVAMQALRAGAANYVPKQAMARDLVPTVKKVLAASAADRDRRRLLDSLRSRVSRFELDNDPDLISALIGLLRDDLASTGFCDAATRTRICVALQEALSNALYHGNLELGSAVSGYDDRSLHDLARLGREQEPCRSRRIRVEARLERDAATYIVEDDGAGFDTSFLRRPIDPDALMRMGGRGLLLIRTFMDEVVHNETGNRITMTKRREGSSS